MTIKVNNENLIFINNLNSANDRLATAMGRLSTGARINTAKDDAAGFMISKGLEVEERGLATANTNIQTGLSLLNIAEGSIQTMLSPLYRIRDLALQSANGIYTKEERNAMQDELDALFNEIVRIKNSTKFNGTNLFGKQVYTDKSQTYVDNETEAPAPIATFGLREESEPTPSMASEPVEENEATTPMPMMMSPRAGGNIIEGTISLSNGQSKTISLGDKTYTFKDSGSGLAENTCNYSYDLTTGKLTLSNTYYIQIVANSGQEDDIKIENAGAYTNVQTSDMADKIEISSNEVVQIYSGDGDDTIISNLTHSTSLIQSGNGNDTIYVNGENGHITANDGDDTIYVNGNNNTILGNGHNDTFIVNGSGNFVSGDGGTNTLTNNGANTGWQDISGLDNFNPNEGTLNTNTNNITLAFNGKKYTVSNFKGEMIQYSYDETTDTVTFSGHYTQIIANDNQVNNVILNSSNMTYTGGNGGKDNIVANNTYQTINLGNGINTLTVNRTRTSIYTNGGNDTINLNSYRNYISCSNSGNIEINIHSGQYENIINGNNNSNLTINDSGLNNGYINCSGYENSLPDSGICYLNVGEEYDITLMKGTEFEVSYTIKNLSSSKVSFVDYTCNPTTGTVEFYTGGSTEYRTQITAHSGQNDKIIATGAYLLLNTGDGNDTVNANVSYYSEINTGDGDDTLNILSTIQNKWDIPEFYTGSGSDTVTIASGVSNIDLYTGDGADTITVNGSNNNIYSEAGEDTIIMNGANNSISTGDDDDIVNINASNESSIIDLGAGADRANINADNAGAIVGGDGDDEFIVASGVSGAFVDGNTGHNTLSGDTSNTYTYNIAGFDNTLPPKGQIAVGGNAEITIEVLGKTYTVLNKAATSSILKFDYSQTDGKMTFEGTSLTISTPLAQTNNVVVNGDDMDFYGGNLQDTIVTNGERNYAYGQGGNDTITTTGGNSYAYGGDEADTIYINGAQNYAFGQNGNDTIVVNGGNAVVQGGANNDTITLNAILGNSSSYVEGNSGNDTINVNSQNNTGKIDAGDGDDTINVNASGNTVLGNGGADTINVYAENTTVEAGGGVNTLGIGASSINYDLAEFTKIKALNNSGSFHMDSGQSLEFEIDGKTYSLYSQLTPTLNYSLDSGVLTLEGADYMEISELDPQDDNLNIIGSNNTIYTDTGNDTIRVQGDGNEIDSGKGDDTVIANGNNTTINVKNGDDTVTLNGTGSISGNDGNKNITALNSDSLIVDLGTGNNSLNVSGDMLDIKLGSGNNTIKASGEMGNVQAGNGDNYLEIDGFGNVINFGNGNNNITNIGDSTTIFTGAGNNIINHEGNNSGISAGGTINAYGDNLRINGDSGADTIKLVGNYGVINSGAGADVVLIEGNANQISLGDGNDNATILGNLNTVTCGNDYDIVTNGGTNTTISNSDELWKAADPFTFQVGTGADSNSTITVETGFVIPIIDLNITTADKARASLDDIDRVIETLTGKMAEIGVSKNRLESAMDANSIAKANIASARSTLADADIAKESMNFIKNQILQNAASSLLIASRNSHQTSLLSIYNSIGNIRR